MKIIPGKKFAPYRLEERLIENVHFQENSEQITG